MITEFIVETIDEIVQDGSVNSEGNLEVVNVPLEKLLFRQTLTLLSSTQYRLVSPVFEESIDVHWGIAYFAKLLPSQGILAYRECMRDNKDNLPELARWSIEYLQFCAHSLEDDALSEPIILESIAATMNNVGYCFLEGSVTNKALLHRGKEYLSRALSLDPAQIFAHNNLGEIYARLGEHDQARRHYALELINNPTHQDALKKLL